MDAWSIYFAGVLSFFSPCILPIIPVYFAILVQDKDKTLKRLLLQGLLFCLGFCVIFSLLGLGAGKVSSLIIDNRTFFSLIAGVIVLIISLKMLDVINIPVLDKSYSFNFNKIRTKFYLL
ncbi:MAG: cytochrome c biogenesis protein CcdA, partial [bacterium]